MRATSGPRCEGQNAHKTRSSSFERSAIRVWTTAIVLRRYCSFSFAFYCDAKARELQAPVNSRRCHELRNYRYIAFNVKNVRGKKYLCMLTKASVLHCKTCVQGAATIQPHRDVINSQSYLRIGCLVLDYLQRGLK